MANNRMWLVHRPTGKRVFLAKRMGWGWYDTPDDLGAKVRALLEATEEDYQTHDDFVLAMEDTSGAPCANGDWHYEDDKIVVHEVKLK